MKIFSRSGIGMAGPSSMTEMTVSGPELAVSRLTIDPPYRTALATRLSRILIVIAGSAQRGRPGLDRDGFGAGNLR